MSQPNGMLSPSLQVTKRDGSIHKNVQVSYRTYRDLKKDLKQQLTESVDNTAHVARSKRGQGWEWFEIWKLVSGKPHLVKEGWQ